MAVGAHPDDVEIGCGGTVARLAGLGYRVGIIDLTDGEPTPLSPGPEVRLAEAESARQVLGAALRIQLGLHNRRLFDSHEARLRLAIEFRRHRPRLVIGMSGRTPTASPDHWQAGQIIDAAIFYSRLTKWDDQFAGLPPHRVERQLRYSLNLDLGVDALPGYQLLQDISGDLDRKLASIRCYATQFPPDKSHVIERVEIIARALGLGAGVAAAERLWSPQAVPVGDVLRAVMPQ